MAEAIASIEMLLQECEAALLEAAGSASTCQIHKEGRVTGGLKVQEGLSWVAYSQGGVDALDEIRRALAGSTPESVHDN
ncbi:MAG: hypothetical protein IPK19_00935 [Chloroflexi bacterium]|nr:hypothetical protein [Chloroflexota bacterium]